MPTEFERDWSYQGKTLAQRMFSDAVVKHCITAFILLVFAALVLSFPEAAIKAFQEILH